MEVKLKILVQLIEDGDYITAYAPSLEVSSYAKTKKEAKKRFHEALDIFLDYTIKNGTLEKVLLDLGWTLRKKPTPTL